MIPNFCKMLSAIAEERNLRWYIKSGVDITIRGVESRALEIFLDEGTNISLYYFDDFESDAITYCTELDLVDPDSINIVMKWLNKTDGSSPIID